MIDVLYVAWNRLEFTIQTFRALAANTNWELVRLLVVHDDGSVDGTREYLEDEITRVPCETLMSRGRVGGPVATMNAYLEMPDRPALFAKVDNDFVMPPRWLDDLNDVMSVSPGLDILGTEPFVGLRDECLAAQTSPLPGGYGYTPAPHIGGKGLLRAACFDGRPMWADGYQGFTQWQTRNPDVTKGWITPDLLSFGLDQLPFEPWISLTEEYAQARWQRHWAKYDPARPGYWQWWLDDLTPA